MGHGTDVVCGWNGSNHISQATGSQWEHESLLRTAGGWWVLHRWSQWQGVSPTNRNVGDTPRPASG